MNEKLLKLDNEIWEENQKIIEGIIIKRKLAIG